MTTFQVVYMTASTLLEFGLVFLIVWLRRDLKESLIKRDAYQAVAKLAIVELKRERAAFEDFLVAAAEDAAPSVVSNPKAWD